MIGATAGAVKRVAKNRRRFIIPMLACGDYISRMATPKLAKPPVSQFAPLADELGALVKEMAPYAQKLSRIETLKKALRSGCTVKDSEEWTVEGARFVAVLGPRANERFVETARLVKTIGAVLYAKFATCTLKDLEANVAPAVVAAVVSSGATGSRSLKTFEKGISA